MLTKIERLGHRPRMSDLKKLFAIVETREGPDVDPIICIAFDGTMPAIESCAISAGKSESTGESFIIISAMYSTLDELHIENDFLEIDIETLPH